MTIRLTLMLLALFPGLTQCPIRVPPTLRATMQGSAQGAYAYMWLGATKDADVRCSAPSCADENINYGGDFSLGLAYGPQVPPGIYSTYVQFYLPELPPGVRVVEAHINMYENAQLQPSTFARGIEEAQGTWGPMQITWADQPNAVSLTGPNIAALGGYRQHNEWRGTIPAQSTDLVSIVTRQLADPDSNRGFIVKGPAGPSYQRGFASLNELSRTEDDLGHSPRLLLKLAVPVEGYLDATNVGLPALPPETDLDEQLDGPGVLMVRVAGGANWPASWDVAFD